MEVGLVKRVDIDQEMQQAYLDYAMSVIVARALPDARDGLKPVQRRILYAMQDLNLGSDSAYKKSARIVGEVLGKYHPHGDVAVYEAMARLAQDFSMRYPLVDGQGNFGSIDGDPPAAMRYTEARLTHFAAELMAQIERNTVDFGDNFDGSLREPLVLPAAIPNLLVNGASGIAVGMATSIPPHNLSEVIDALTFMIAGWERLDEIAVPDLMRFVKGPDFPTGGIILQDSGENAMEAAYGSGRGRVIVRGRVHAEDLGRGRTRLIISELPYQVNKTNLIERIAELARNGDLDGIADLRDESDRQGMRIVIELKQGAEVEGTLRTLYKSTPLQNTFGINLLALVDNEPRLLNLKQALRVFIEHRLTVVRRRSEYDLARARHRAHILEGLRVALKNLNEVISLIRSAPDTEQARQRLMKRFNLTEIQAQAILDMQLRRLAALERKKIEEEYKEVTALVKELEGLLRSPKRMREVVGEELLAMKQAYGDRRRTQIVSLAEGVSATHFLTANDLAPSQKVWVGVTRDGRIARSHGEALPELGGEGIVSHLLQTSTRDTLYLLAHNGAAAAVAISALAEAETFSDGAPLYKSSSFAPDDRLVAMFAVGPEASASEDAYVLAVSRQGMIKKSTLSELPGPSAQKFTLIKINPGDEALTAMLTGGKDGINLITELGMAIRFAEEEVRPMGLVAAGVMGIKLAQGDGVAAAAQWEEKADLLFLASDGTALRVPAAEFPQQGRYGQGVIACRLNPGVKISAFLIGGKNTAGLIYCEKADPKRVRVGDAALGKRAQKTAVFLHLKPGDRVLGITRLGEEAAKPRKQPSAPAAPDGGKSEKPRQSKSGAEPVSAAAPVKDGKKKTAAVQENRPAAKKTSVSSSAPGGAKPGQGKSVSDSQDQPPVSKTRSRVKSAAPVEQVGYSAGKKIAAPKAPPARKEPLDSAAGSAASVVKVERQKAVQAVRGPKAAAGKPFAGPDSSSATPEARKPAKSKPAAEAPVKTERTNARSAQEGNPPVKPAGAASSRPAGKKPAPGKQASLPGLDE